MRLLQADFKVNPDNVIPVIHPCNTVPTAGITPHATGAGLFELYLFEPNQPLAMLKMSNSHETISNIRLPIESLLRTELVS